MYIAVSTPVAHVIAAAVLAAAIGSVIAYIFIRKYHKRQNAAQRTSRENKITASRHSTPRHSTSPIEPEASENQDIPTYAHADPFISDFIKIIDRHLSDSSLSVAGIADEIGMSRAQLFRKVKQATGMSPNRLIREYRLDNARRMLEAGGRSVQQVCYLTGFSSPSYFCKCYKDRFGESASATKRLIGDP